MNTRWNQMMKRSVALALLLACLGALTAGFAQLDPGSCGIFQNGQKVGEIYVPVRLDQGLYAEPWILYPNYAYPNARNSVKTEIIPDAGATYTSEANFFARAPFGPGYRYVYVSNDSTHLPRP